MTPRAVSEVFDELGGAEINPYGWTWGPLRVHAGGGIAGNGDKYWLTFPGEPDLGVRGPFTTKRALRAELRRLIVATLRFGDALLAFGEEWSK